MWSAVVCEKVVGVLEVGPGGGGGCRPLLLQLQLPRAALERGERCISHLSLFLPPLIQFPPFRAAGATFSPCQAC